MQWAGDRKGRPYESACRGGRPRPPDVGVQYFCRAGPVCPAAGAGKIRGGPMWASAPTKAYHGVRRGGGSAPPAGDRKGRPYGGVQGVREKNPPVTASPCQPPLGKGAEGTGVRIATASLRTGLAMTGGFTRGAVQRGVGDAAPYGCIIDGAVGRTEASTPTEVYLAVRRGAFFV